MSSGRDKLARLSGKFQIFWCRIRQLPRARKTKTSSGSLPLFDPWLPSPRHVARCDVMSRVSTVQFCPILSHEVPFQKVTYSSIRSLHGRRVVCQYKSAPLFGTNSLNSVARTPTNQPCCQISVLKVDAIRAGRNARVACSHTQARAHSPCQVVGSPLHCIRSSLLRV